MSRLPAVFFPGENWLPRCPSLAEGAAGRAGLRGCSCWRQHHHLQAQASFPGVQACLPLRGQNQGNHHAQSKWLVPLQTWMKGLGPILGSPDVTHSCHQSPEKVVLGPASLVGIAFYSPQRTHSRTTNPCGISAGLHPASLQAWSYPTSRSKKEPGDSD